MSAIFDPDWAPSSPTLVRCGRRDQQGIVMSLHVAAITLTDGPGSTFTADELIARALELAGDEVEIRGADIETVLGKTGFLKKTGGRYRLKRGGAK